MDIQFWGMRGGVPVCRPDAARYGGNTACVEIRCGKTQIVLDAGSGLINLGEKLMSAEAGYAQEINLFLTHLHWDHVMGIPFFLPVYQRQGVLHLYGIAGTDKALLSLFRGAEASDLFPVPLGKPTMEIVFHELQESTCVGEATVSYYYLNHPGLTIGYRVEGGGKSVLYLTDNEPYRSTNRELVKNDNDARFLARIDREVVQFAKSADLLIADALYSEDDYAGQIGTGHSSVHEALQVALSAQAKKLVLFHHPPFRTDDQIDLLAQKCRARLETLKSKLEVLTPAEGEIISL